jgi:hypothetical protein
MKHSVTEAWPAVALVLILCVGAVFPERALAASGAETNDAFLFDQLTTLDPHSSTKLTRLAEIAGWAVKSDKNESKAEKKLARHSTDLQNLPATELKKLFTDDSPKYEVRAISTIQRLALEALQADDARTRAARAADISEVQASLRNGRRPLVPDNLGFITTWVYFFKNLSGSIGHGTTMAADLAGAGDCESDGGRRDPPPSSFWTRPPAIPGENLYTGFGRDRLPHLEKSLCEYSGPKVSSGTHAGFDVECGGQRFKIKFGEDNSEPFTARIFYALGYQIDPTDYAPRVKVRYDRRLFREFHLRKPLTMRITPLGIRVWTIQLQTHFDPFAFIRTAVFKDGRSISGAALKKILFKDPNRSHPEDSSDNFRSEVEATLDYLVTAPANVQPREGPTQSIGSWEFGGLGHENRR